LLAPSPETAALFDELILMHEGQIIYNGPVGDSLKYFESLGYKMPDRVDPADWLLVSFVNQLAN
jgi:ABC-type multidrug transport system ATPase subunit